MRQWVTLSSAAAAASGSATVGLRRRGRANRRSGGRAQITGQVGYADVATFSTLFKRQVGLSPAQYRRSFHAQAVNNGRA